MTLYKTVDDLARDFYRHGFVEGTRKSGELDASANKCVLLITELLKGSFPRRDFIVEVSPGCCGCENHTAPIHHKVEVIRPQSEDWDED